MKLRIGVDVGGTFTDVVARPRGGAVQTMKLLSTGAIRGTVGEGSTVRIIRDRNRIGDPESVWVGYTFALESIADPIYGGAPLSVLLSGAGTITDNATEEVWEAGFSMSAINMAAPWGPVAFSVHVPEPASLALLGLGLIGMGAARRRRA